MPVAVFFYGLWNGGLKIYSRESHWNVWGRRGGLAWGVDSLVAWGFYEAILVFEMLLVDGILFRNLVCSGYLFNYQDFMGVQVYHWLDTTWFVLSITRYTRLQLSGSGTVKWKSRLGEAVVRGDLMVSKSCSKESESVCFHIAMFYHLSVNLCRKIPYLLKLINTLLSITKLRNAMRSFWTRSCIRSDFNRFELFLRGLKSQIAWVLFGWELVFLTLIQPNRLYKYF